MSASCAAKPASSVAENDSVSRAASSWSAAASSWLRRMDEE